jgi:hypothetical protein
MVLVCELILEDDAIDKIVEVEDEFLIGLNEDKLLYSEECLN